MEDKRRLDVESSGFDLVRAAGQERVPGATAAVSVLDAAAETRGAERRAAQAAGT